MRWVVRSMVAGVAYTAGVSLWLLLPGDHPVPAGVWVPAFAAAIPLFGIAVVSWRAKLPADLLPRPGAWVVGVVAVLAAAAIGMLAAMFWSAQAAAHVGQPGIRDGRYVLNNHGAITPISREQYLRYLEADQLGFVGLAMVFELVAIASIGVAIERGQRPPVTR